MICAEIFNETLLQEIKELNKDFYGAAILEWYVNPAITDIKCVTYRNKDKQLKGYIVATCISKEYYTALIHGENIDCLEQQCNLYVKQSDYWYISSIIVSKEEREKGIGTQMMAKLLEYPFKFLCAFTISSGGLHVLKKFMTVVDQISDNCYILERVV